MNKLSMFFIFIFILVWSNVSHTAKVLPDESEIGRDLSVPYQAIDSVRPYSLCLLYCWSIHCCGFCVKGGP